MRSTPQSDQEFCPDCGEFVDQLNEWTGFCYNCTPSTQSRVERWLIKYADTVEYVMQVQGITAKLAIIEVHATYKATCIICDEPIKHGTHGRHFICSSTPECRKARRRYKYAIYEKGMSKEDALALILKEKSERNSASQQ